METLIMCSLDNKRTWFSLPTPTPKNYEPTYTHEEKSFIDARGYFHRDIIRKNRGKLFCGWNGLSGDKVALLQSLYDYDYIHLRYTDKKNQRVTQKMYAGPLSGKAAKLSVTDLKIKFSTDNQMNFIEY